VGGTGTGKTVAAALAAKLWLAQGVDTYTPSGGIPPERVVWVAAPELASLSTFDREDRAWLSRMERAALLVLDEVGSEALTEHAQSRLERLIDARYAAMKETVVASNCSVELLKERVGQRITDRIREAGRVVNCGNVSLRGVKP
jgi:DNA replication protein DnaC